MLNFKILIELEEFYYVCTERRSDKLSVEKGHTAGTEWVMGERKLAEETKSTPRPPETDDVSGCACGIINNNLARVQAQSHFEQSTNDLKMGRGKRAGYRPKCRYELLSRRRRCAEGTLFVELFLKVPWRAAGPLLRAGQVVRVARGGEYTDY